MMSSTGGVRPPTRTRSARCLSATEREEISRGLAAGEPLRAIARRLGRAPSTVSREVARNGGLARYRARDADGRAWRRATRPTRRPTPRTMPSPRSPLRTARRRCSPSATPTARPETYSPRPTPHRGHLVGRVVTVGDRVGRGPGRPGECWGDSSLSYGNYGRHQRNEREGAPTSIQCSARDPRRFLRSQGDRRAHSSGYRRPHPVPGTQEWERRRLVRIEGPSRLTQGPGPGGPSMATSGSRGPRAPSPRR